MPPADTTVVSIPPPLIRSEFVNEVKAQAEELLPPQIATVVRQAPQLLLQAITDLESPRMTFGRVALMGDAAFIARPACRRWSEQGGIECPVPGRLVRRGQGAIAARRSLTTTGCNTSSAVGSLRIPGISARIWRVRPSR